MKNSELSSRTINRLTQYHAILREYSKKSIQSITSVQISKMLKVDETQVRKDIKSIKCKGRCKVGYSVVELKKRIDDVLDCKNVKRAFVIGAGNLGSALTKYSKFREFGLEIVGIFDVDNSKIGKNVRNLIIKDLNCLKDEVTSNDVNIAILTIPNSVAQKTCDFLVDSGIKYIWNFTPAILNVKDDIQVWHENLIGSFLQFCATKIS